MQEVLRALDHRRPARLLGDIQEPLHPEKPRPEVLRDAVEQELRLLARKWALAGQDEALDPPALEMALPRVVMMLMIVARVAVVMGMVRVLVGLDVEPGTRIGSRIGRVEPGGLQEPRDFRRRPVDLGDPG